MSIDTLKRLPLFVSNQVLTAELLNNMSQYLDQQTRLATLRGMGRGIVCGLEMTVNADQTITINAGYGFTSDGYLIQYEGGTFGYYNVYSDPVYTLSNDSKSHDFQPESYLYKNWQKMPPPKPQQIALWELKANITNIATITNNIALTSDFLKDKCVVLYLEFSFKDLHSCVTSNCNNKGWELVLDVKPLLVLKNDLTALFITTRLVTKTFKAIPRLHKRVILSNLSSTVEIMQGYKAIVDDIAPKLDQFIATAYNELKSKFDLGAVAPLPITPKITNIPTAAVTWQLAYDFLKDLVDAYNEFFQIACPFLSVACLPTQDFGRHLTLGAVNSAYYRHLFESATILTATQSEITSIQRFFKRLAVLIEYFEPNPTLGTPFVRISPSHTAAVELGRRAVPFYYSTADDWVKQYWQANNPCIRPELTGYHFQDFAETAELDHDFDWNYDKNNFFRIEGHVGQPVAQVVSDLVALKTSHQLEFELRTLPLSPKPTLDPHANAMFKLRQMILMVNYKLAEKQLRQYDNWRLDYPMMSSADFKSAFREVMEPFYNNDFTTPLRQWEQTRCGMSVSCDIGFLELDYSLLRGEVLTHFKRFKRVFKPVMKAYKFSFREYAKPHSNLPINLTKKDVGTLTQLKLFWRYLHLLSDELMPRNLVAFNYPIFIEIFKEWHRIVYELRASISGFWANELIEDLIKTTGSYATFPNNQVNFEPFPNFKERLRLYLDRQTGDFNHNTKKADEAFSVFAGLMNHLVASLSDVFVFINSYFEDKMQQQLAMLYYSLESIITRNTLIFKDFAHKQTGLEHLSGVEKGGTFLLVIDDTDKVIADFALSGRAAADDYKFKPEQIRLPPIAGINVVYIVAKQLFQKERNVWQLVANTNIGVLRNDFSLRKPTSACAKRDNSDLFVMLPFSVSERNAKLEMMRKHWGMIHYDMSLELTNTTMILETAVENPTPPITYDLFDYELRDVNGLFDRGKVIVIILPRPFFEVRQQGIGVIVSGHVTADGKPIRGTATVKMKGTNISVPANSNGYYTFPEAFLKMDTPYSLVASCEGYTTVEARFLVPLDRTNIEVNIQLESSLT